MSRSNYGEMVLGISAETAVRHCIVCDSDAVCLTSCKDCGDGVCTACVSSGKMDVGRVASVSVNCSMCDGIVCSDCNMFCGQCLKETGEAATYCTACVPRDLREADCTLHTWFNCGKHSGGVCGNC